MAQTSIAPANRVFDEDTHCVVSFTLKDHNGNTIGSAELSTLTLTLYNEGDGSIINGRNGQDVLNANDVVVNTAGVVTWTVQQRDTVIVDSRTRSGELESHVAIFAWDYSSSGKGGKLHFRMFVRAELKV